MSDPIDVVIFNFTDKNLHNNSADLAFIYDATVREILRQDVRSVLREMPDDAAVFVTLRPRLHAGARRRPSRCRIRCVTDSGDVKYRVGRLKAAARRRRRQERRAVQGRRPRHPRQDPEAQRGRSGRSTTSLFPRPGLTLKRPQGARLPTGTRTAG